MSPTLISGFCLDAFFSGEAEFTRKDKPNRTQLPCRAEETDWSLREAEEAGSCRTKFWKEGSYTEK